MSSLKSMYSSALFPERLCFTSNVFSRMLVPHFASWYGIKPYSKDIVTALVRHAPCTRRLLDSSININIPTCSFTSEMSDSSG